MTTEAKTLFDEKLLSRWQEGGAPAMAPRSGDRADATCRPGYGLFKLMLAFSLFSGIFTVLPWTLA